MNFHRLLPVAALLAPLAAPAHEDGQSSIDEIVVFGRAESLLGAAQSASEGVVGYADLELAPLLRVGELTEAVPGMVATQHSGTGKANQYFLRGFNLDHGTDFSAMIDGMPINMRTHGHGQGYLDLNFLIPELIEQVTYRKGPYSRKTGDFSSAGSVEFGLTERLESATVRATVGEFDHLRGFAAGTVDAGDAVFTGAVDVTRYSGPWEIDEDLRQVRAFGRVAGQLGRYDAAVTFMGYTGEWNSTDQIPRRAVESGLISPLGFIDPDLGGSTDRYSLSARLESDNWTASAYIIDYDFTLYSNFTYLLEDPVNGDQFEQRDSRTIVGGRIDGHRHWSERRVPVRLAWGADIRYDDIDEVALFPTVARERNGVVRRDAVSQGSIGGYAELSFAFSERLRGSLGARIDHFDFEVDARLAENGGSGTDTLATPSAGLAYLVSDAVEVYANWGQGFHSNDVRGATIVTDPASGDPADPVDVLVPSQGAELGLRFESGDRINATIAAFWLGLDSELVFVGDAGATEPNAPTNRYGVEFSAFLRATDWLAANFDATHVDARFDVPGNEDRIPGAVETTASLGINLAFENRIFGGARLRYLGEAPLVEDNSVRSNDSLLVNASLGYRWERMELRLDAFNLFDSTDDDISYFYASRLPNEPAEGVEDVHFHPLEPRSLRLSLAYRWP